MPKEWEIEYMPVDRLRLDGENPRLASLATSGSPSQIELIKILWNEMSVAELVLSIAANGYFKEEPLFVIPAVDSEDLIVVEGNRRLAAVMILLDDEIREELKATDMPTINEEEKEALRYLPVSIYESRESLWAYLSFRHINTPQEWDSYSKAMYVAKVHDTYGVPLAEIAKKIGDQHDTVIRMYRGYKLLRQAQEDGVYDITERFSKKLYFSHWYTALAYSQIQEFLGIDAEDFEKAKPVSESNLKELAELLTWIYGKKTSEERIEPLVKRQNPDLGNLRDVISTPNALDALRSGYGLKRSYEISIGDERRFREALSNAKEEIQQARGTVTVGYKGGDAQYEVINDILRVSKSLRNEMEEIRENGAEANVSSAAG
jgi:hypothetical protein